MPLLLMSLFFLLLSPMSYAQNQTQSKGKSSLDDCKPDQKKNPRSCLGVPPLSSSPVSTLSLSKQINPLETSVPMTQNNKNHTTSDLDSTSTLYSPRGALNLLGTPLKQCCTSPMTGYERDGFCHTQTRDRGLHVVCARITSEFLEYTKAQGNDLSSPAPHYGFPGLKPGDHWCLCAARWLEAHRAGVAPPIDLEASEASALKLAPLSLYQEYDFSKRATISSPPKASK